MIRLLTVTLCTLVICVGAASGQTLKPGDPAPKLSTVTWLRGEPVPSFEPGEVYVLDFWATWCGPCIMSIPHVAQMQKKYADKHVNVIGVAVFPRPGAKPVRSFIAARPDMAYRIAEDDRHGTAAINYLKATNSPGIPVAVIVDKEGKVAWVGHPMDRMEEVLEKVVAGTFDPGEEQRAALQHQQVLLKAQGLRQKLIEAQQAEDWELALQYSDALVQLDPTIFGTAGVYHYYILLVQLDDEQRARTYGQSLLKTTLAQSPSALNEMAWKIASHKSFPDEKRDLDLALQAANRADELFGGHDASTLDTLAKLAFMRGDIELAVTYASKAVGLEAEGTFKDTLKSSLDKYRAALALKSDD